MFGRGKLVFEKKRREPLHPFEAALSVGMETIEFELWGHQPAPWADFWLNPRKLRGSDFLMRWSQDEWSEARLTEAINETDEYLCYPYGPSGVAPDEVREFELYFERLEKAGLGTLKRPDLLLFSITDRQAVEATISSLGGLMELPFTSEDDPRMQELLHTALIAIECENSLWASKMMPDYGKPLRKQRRLGGKLGLAKNAVVPTVILKEEDRGPLLEWQTRRGVPIHIWHIFYDQAFGLSLDEAQRLIEEGYIDATIQTFQATGGATQKKPIYKIYYQYAYPLGTTKTEPTLKAASLTDKNGHILPYVTFDGGSLDLNPNVLDMLESVAASRRPAR